MADLQEGDIFRIDGDEFCPTGWLRATSNPYQVTPSMVWGIQCVDEQAPPPETPAPRVEERSP